MFAILSYGLVGLCGWGPGRHVVQRGALKGTIHRPNWTRANHELCLLVFIQTSVASKEHPGREWSAEEQTNRSAPCLPSAPVLPPCLCDAQAFHSYFPLQSVLPLWLVLCLCWRSVPAFKGNNYCCIPPSEQTLWQQLCDIKLCLYGLLLCHSELHIMSLTCPELLIINMNVWWSKDMTMINKNIWKVVSTRKRVDSSRVIFSSCGSCNLGTASILSLPGIHGLLQPDS